ncbi:uncharacterized protein LOC128257315 [Drosophila gunungcola]|uniref:Secreted protein n=1 Tax=Drosophila gunungcola TaxID=103775 RepID=A0A9P9YRE8_9MUSC|nr:uncharacterized protein LOC128257315 [Drosophila gunungcola]KAI8041711.1 hypothetical protein M5D96_005978 [Drosophila gunungcola]
MAMAPLLHLLLHCATTLLIANALVLNPQQLLSSEGNEGKSKVGFPIDLDEGVDGVDLPLEVEKDVIGEGANARSQHSMPPDWLTFDEPTPPVKHRTTSNHKPQLILKHPTGGFHKLAAHGHRHCHVEVVSKVQGICQPMPIGSACVSDDYMDLYTDANCSTQ